VRNIVPNNCGETLLQIRDLTVTYSRQGELPIHALDAINLEIHTGEVVGVLGESGSGKSTLALALLRLLPEYAQHHGSILFRGQDVLRLPEPGLRHIRGKHISLISQDPALSLNPVITVGEQIAEVMRAHLPLNIKQRRRATLELLEEVGFQKPTDIYDAYPHQVSGGQRQRIVIAQAIACRPALVIADEATSKLDAPLQADILLLLSQIQARHSMAFLVITHDPSILPGFADRIVIMYAGHIVEEAGTKAVFREPLHPYTQALMRLITHRGIEAAERASNRLPVLEGEPPNLTRVAVGCRFEPRCSERLEACATCDPPQTMPKPSRRVSCFKYGI
jgi:oligopeptide/dipeptide ABC transporter ATP-binding protein